MTMNTNTTASTLNTTALNKKYYDRQLLEGAKTRFVFTKYGQKHTVPLNNGKHVEFRRWNLFDVDQNMCALEEGKTPEGQSLSQSSVEATLTQYGAYVEVSDLLEDTAYDKVLSDSAELLGEQIGTVMEWVTRDAVCSGNNVQRIGGQNRVDIDNTCTLTVNEIRKAVRTLKKAKARPFAADGRRPHFICICSPDAVYDLQNDPLWQDVSKYSNAESIYSGEIGRLFGVVFIESTESKVLRQAVYTKVKSHAAGSDTIYVKELTKEGEAYLNSGNAVICIDNKGYRVKHADSATGSIQVVNEIASAIAADSIAYTDNAGKMGADKKGCDVHMSVLFGKDAYGVIDLENGALESIVKPRGSAGADDPLDQRATVGAKVTGFAAVILNELWIVRIEHGVSA